MVPNNVLYYIVIMIEHHRKTSEAAHLETIHGKLKAYFS